ncbi:MAG: prepilin-type N-terminal cleavage/methylation domain-containing protein [Pseudomonadota bacterium]
MHKKCGFSLIELMIAMLIALIIISAVMSIYVSTIKNSRNLLSSASLSQELTAVMNILVNDIRRSGFYSGAAENPQIKNNPFYIIKGVLPQTKPASYFMPFAIHINSKQNCISLAYDADQDTGVNVQQNDVFAFRLKKQAIQTLQQVKLSNFSKHGCANNAGSWMNITDNGLIRITRLKFSSLGSRCYHMASQKQWQITANTYQFPCLSVKDKLTSFQAGDRLIETQLVNIQIQAHLSSDSKVEKLLSQQVRIRNDMVLIIP